MTSTARVVVATVGQITTVTLQRPGKPRQDIVDLNYNNSLYATQTEVGACGVGEEVKAVATYDKLGFINNLRLSK